jgi:hypothetical protein|nr:MAG TPA: Proline dehydrogenase/DNA Complex, Proline, Utilization, DNA, DNA [Caudoviricetes sp.]
MPTIYLKIVEEKKIRPQEKWSKSNNYVAKSFKMYKELADEFKLACEKAGVSQSGQIVKMMKDFIRSQKES